MNDFDKLFKEVLREAYAAGLPVSQNISPNIKVNNRAKRRFGQCILKNGEYTIELSSRLLYAPEKSCKQTIAHELIHTCKGCYNHGVGFKRYALLMNTACGYNIKTTNSCEEMGIDEVLDNNTVKYILVCQACGKKTTRLRYSSVVANPSRYRCRCGGELKRIK